MNTYAGGQVNLPRIRREFEEARQRFDYIELNPTSDGNVYVKVALQTPQQLYIASIYFPDTYPNEMPKVHIVKPTFAGSPPHYYQAGNICYLHPTMWNPGMHHLTFVVMRTAKWLNKYEVWKRTGSWPGASIAH